MRNLLADARVRFLLAGGSAALVNWLVRFPLHLVMPYGAAVLTSVGIAMIYGFGIYRSWAFRDGSPRPLALQVRDFVAVNAAGGGVQFLVAILFAPVIAAVASSVMAEATAHALGIAAGAVVNYLGHRYITFGRSPTEPTSLPSSS